MKSPRFWLAFGLGNTLVSDALFTAILFGAFATVERRVPRFA